MELIECKPQEAKIFWCKPLGFSPYSYNMGLVKTIGKYLKPLFDCDEDTLNEAISKSDFNVVKENYSFTYNEFYSLINKIMQFKADLEVIEGNTKQAFTPQYHIDEFIKVYHLEK